MTWSACVRAMECGLPSMTVSFMSFEPAAWRALVVSAAQRKRGRLTGSRERRWGSGRVLVHDILRFLVAA